MAGAATNPDPEVFAYAAAQVKDALEVTHELGGAELRALGRARRLRDAAQHRPEARARPARPLPLAGGRAQAQDRLQGHDPDRAQAAGADQAPVRLRRRHRATASCSATGCEKEVKVNIERNHAILAGHSFEHEIALAQALGIFGSIDMNRGDDLLGWDTDQFPNNVPRDGAGVLLDPEGRRLHDRRPQFRRQAAAPVDRSGRPDPRPCRRDGCLRARAARGRRR